jgi:hypothetical protein
MDLPMRMRRSLLSLALVALVGTAAVAQASDETLIAVKTRAGTIERVDAGDVSTLQPGEVRALSTRSGSAATITRNDDGLVLAIAGDQYPIAMPVDDGAFPGDMAAFHQARSQEARSGAPDTHKIIVIKHKGEHDAAGVVDEALAGLPNLEDDEALLAAGDGPKVFVQRRKVIEKSAEH